MPHGAARKERSASFQRRVSSRAQADAERPAERPASASASASASTSTPDVESGSKNGIGRLLRSASFERRRRVSKADATTNSAPGATESEGSSSLSEATPTDDRPMAGWLYKRHSREKSVESLQWAHRHFSVDDVRGTLIYAKAETFSYGKNPALKKASAILPLADISQVGVAHHGALPECHPDASVPPLKQVVALEGKDIGAPENDTCFLISCPPVHFTVCAKDLKVRASLPPFLAPLLPAPPPGPAMAQTNPVLVLFSKAH